MREVYLIENFKDIKNLFCLPSKEMERRGFKPEVKFDKLKVGIFGEIDGKEIIMKYDWMMNRRKDGRHK